MSVIDPSSDLHTVVARSAGLFRLSVEQYHEMIERGILGPDDHVELLEGVLVAQMPTGPKHRVTKRKLADALRRLCPPGYYVDEQVPITTPASEPEPDVYIARGTPDDFAEGHPTPADIALVVEVADTTFERDSGWKRDIYARAGIRLYWVVAIAAQAIDVYAADTAGEVFAEPRRYSAGDKIPVVLDGRTIGSIVVADVLPK